jgi:FlaA1/EpsC-like NDP-sugar epimerase
MLAYMAIGVIIESAVLLLSRIERRSWANSSVHDLLALGSVVLVGTVLMSVVAWILHDIRGFPRTVPLISGTLALLGMGGVRLFLRIYQEERARSAAGAVKKVLLVGAGDSGSRMVREMRRSPATGMVPVGYLDDRADKQGLRVSGSQVLGRIDDLARVAKRHQIDEILITMPSAPGSVTRRVVDLARAEGLPCRIMPSLEQLLSGEVDFTSIRPVQVDDLLRREPAAPDEVGLEAYIRDKVVLVSGAGGSIGSEIVRQIARFGPQRVVLLGRGENPLHELERILALHHPDLDYVIVVGNVCEAAKMADVFATHSPDIVFHTAAHKHVPMMQYNPDEAVLNNVGGTRILAEAALAAGVGRFVNISTDKAVNPVSMMGGTKYLAELVVRRVAERAGENQAFVSVRFGNVLGSRGSVVPVFEEQIRQGGPITITDPDTTRYFMTIPEATQLVLQAGAMAHNGSVYVLDMGEPVRIIDLAGDLVRLTGGAADNVEFVFTGMRPGEKLHEELFADNEKPEPTRNGQILVARQDSPLAQDLFTHLDRLLSVAAARDWAGIDREMASLLPTPIARQQLAVE